MNNDADLLRRYFEEGVDGAFAELVRRHVDLVYSAALRQVNGDPHLAADATQIVFSDLARKGGALVGHRVLAGWLFTSTRFAVAELVRGESRRADRGEIRSDAPGAKCDELNRTRWMERERSNPAMKHRHSAARCVTFVLPPASEEPPLPL